MSCCAVPIEPHAHRTTAEEVRLASHALDGGRRQSDISIPTIHCGACIRTIESELAQLRGVEHVRVNLSTKRVAVRWIGSSPPPLLEELRRLGYEAHLCDPEADRHDGQFRKLILSLAVAGFASGNIMMLSVGVWAGAEASTRDMFHGLSAFIALPALVYSGRIFFDSAWNAIRHGRTNMDVPISVGVLLAFALSVYETLVHGAHAYFDAATMLLFFLLVGRTLDHLMRERARVAVKGLARLAARGAMVVAPDGTRTYRPLGEIEPGMSILLAAGERVPVDCIVSRGRSEIDCALVTGESLPQPAIEGTRLQAGTLNLTGALTVSASSSARDSFLAEMMRMMVAAEAGRSAYRRVADRVARYYAPVVHLTALLTFAGWMLAGADFHRSATVAIAVLIITCPCALGLAVPMVQVAAARRLFESGIMVKDGAALERLAEIDGVVFDKTGTITLGRPSVSEAELFDPDAPGIAAAMASQSRHPYSVAVSAVGEPAVMQFAYVRELPGRGLEASNGASVYRLGRSDWAAAGAAVEDAATVALARDGRLLALFRLDDRLREGAQAAARLLRDQGLALEIVSGDGEQPVANAARTLGVRHFSRISPAGKVEHLASAAAAGRKLLMVGDGLNDAPALAAAHASMAPASAADVGRNAADLVFLRESLMAVPRAIAVARQAGRLVRQNVVLAAVYNAVAVPVAIAGEVTPLIAAAAMSLSSVLVVANSLRLGAAASPEGSSRVARPASTVAAEGGIA
jgi:Cu2+-exporting ATPase